MLYRKRITIDVKALSSNDDYPMHGINEIMRLHLHRFTNKMDNPVVTIDSMTEDGSINSSNVEKIYYIHIVFQLRHDGDVKYNHFCISTTRDGVLDIIKHQ